MQIHVHKDGQQYGPYTIEQLREYVQQGYFTAADHACHDGQNWVTIGQVPGFAAAAQAQPQQVAQAQQVQAASQPQQQVAQAQAVAATASAATAGAVGKKKIILFSKYMSLRIQGRMHIFEKIAQENRNLPLQPSVKSKTSLLL